MIPIHPQRCAGEPDRLRWIVPAGVLPFAGPAAAVPSPLADLLADGTLAAVRPEPNAVLTALGSGRDWARDGARIRTALHAALAQPDGWTQADGVPDESLRAAAQDLIDGSVGRFVRSHGGTITLIAVRGPVVTVALAGACHGCPAAEHTLRRRLQDELRVRVPHVAAIVTA